MKNAAGISAAVGGRRMTLDPIGMGDFTVTLPVREVEVPIVAGFQSQWGEVETGDPALGTVELSAGAGMGSQYAVLKLGPDGARRYFIVDANDLLNLIVRAVVGKPHSAPDRLILAGEATGTRPYSHMKRVRVEDVEEQAQIIGNEVGMPYVDVHDGSCGLGYVAAGLVGMPSDAGTCTCRPYPVEVRRR